MLQLNWNFKLKFDLIDDCLEHASYVVCVYE